MVHVGIDSLKLESKTDWSHYWPTSDAPGVKDE